jgi:tetratricopeptide (TPR) repeat protein
MAKKRLNKKMVYIGSAVFLFAALLLVVLFLRLSRDPKKFIQDGALAVETAKKQTDEESRLNFYKEAERNYRKAFGYAKTDELKVEILHRIAEVFVSTEKWRDVVGCWTQIVRLEPKDMSARYNRLKYFYIVAQSSQGMIWQDIATQATELIELVESPSASPELAQTDVSKWEIDALRDKREPNLKIAPYLYLIRGRANYQSALYGIVPNREETLKQAVADLEKVRQLEPEYPETYLYLAQAVNLTGRMEAAKGDTEAKEKRTKEAIDLLKQGVEATHDSQTSNINLLTLKQDLIRDGNEAEQRSQLLAMEPQYIALGTRFSSSAPIFASIAFFYSDFRLGPSYLDKSIEAIEKARQLDNNNVEYAITAVTLYLRSFNARMAKEDWDKAVEISKAALLLPDAQETSGPRSAIVNAYRIMLNSLLINSALDRILDSAEPLPEAEGKQLLEQAQAAQHRIEQIFTSGEDPQVIKWQGMVELAAAKLNKGDFASPIRKLYKVYTQLKASERSDPQLSYRLAKVFANGPESGAVAEFLTNAVLNGIELWYPEARLDYDDVLLRAGLAGDVLNSLDIFEQRCGVTDRSRMQRINAYIIARDFNNADELIEQMSQQDPNRIALRAAVLEGACRQVRVIMDRRRETPGTRTVLRDALGFQQQQPPESVNKLTNEQLLAKIESNLSAFLGCVDELLSKDPNLLTDNIITSMCDDAIATGYLEQANLIIDKVLKNQPENTTALIYKRRLGEPDPAKIAPERWKQIREEVILKIADPAMRTFALGFFYQTSGDSDKAAEQFKKLADVSGGAEAMKVDDTLRRRATELLFNITIDKKDWDTADKILQIAKKDNLDDCSGDFLAARLAFTKGQYETALAAIESALKQRPVFGYGYMLRSRINDKLGNETAALADIQTAWNTNPMDRVIARERASRLYLRNQRLGDSVTTTQLAETRNAINWAMALNPGDLDLMSFYAEYISTTEPDKALAIRQSLQQNAPSVRNALLLANLASRLATESDNQQRKEAFFEMAKSALDQAQTLDPQNPDVLESYAEYYRQRGQRGEAEKMLTGAKESGLLWRYYIRAGQFDNARKILEQSYQANPRDVNTIKGLLYVAEKTSDKTSVIKYAEQLISVEDIPDNHLLAIQTCLNTGLVSEADKKLASFRERYPDNAGGLLLGAWLSMNQGRLKQALELTNKRLETNQNDAVAWRLRGQINLLQTNYNDAISDLKRSKTLLDASETRILLTRAYLKTGREEDAITELKSTVEDPQASDRARLLLEEIYRRTNRKEALKDFYDKVVEQFPENVFWLNRAADFAAVTDNKPKAEQLFHTALQKSEQRGKLDIDALGFYLQALLVQDKYDKLFEEAQKYIDGQFASVAYYRMAQAKLAIGDKNTAIQYCSKAIDKTNNNLQYISSVVSRIYDILGQDQVENLCKQKLDSQPDSSSANWAMFNIKLLNREYNKAVEYLDVCLKKTASDTPDWTNIMMKKAEVLGLAYYRTSDKSYFKEMTGVYESLITKMPNNTNVLNNLAYIFAENNQDLDKALEYIKRAKEIKPNDAGYMDTYALVLYKQGKFAEALEISQAAIQQYEMQQVPVTVDVYEHLGQIQERLGNVQQALAAYKQALEVGGKNTPKEARERLTAAIERLGKAKDSDNGQK